MHVCYSHNIVCLSEGYDSQLSNGISVVQFDLPLLKIKLQTQLSKNMVNEAT